MIIFHNKGTLDPRAITTFGVSSKEGENNIGFFGTGLKYAIAILLRHNCRVTIMSGGHTWQFSTVEERIRVSDFQTVTMNGERLAFTTELGKTWELWQAYRELFCNCADENGEVGTELPDTHPDSRTSTTVIVEGENFEKVHENRMVEVLCPETSVVRDDGILCQIRRGSNRYIYYRGIRAYETRRPAMFTYNLRAPMELSEDRNMKWEYRIRTVVGTSIMISQDEELIEKVILAEDDTFEGHIDFDICPGHDDREGMEVFARVVRDVAKRYPNKINRSAMRAAKMSETETLPQETEPGILTGVNEARMIKAVNFCKDLGFEVDRYKIIVVTFIGEGVLGRAHKDKIYISARAFDQGTKILVGTLIEEFLHLSRNCDDCTREMQNILVDTIVTMGEKLTGEPL